MSLFVAQTLNKQNEHEPLNMPLMFCKIIRNIVFLFFGRFSKILKIDIDPPTITFVFRLISYVFSILYMILIVYREILGNYYCGHFQTKYFLCILEANF